MSSVTVIYFSPLSAEVSIILSASGDINVQMLGDWQLMNMLTCSTALAPLEGCQCTALSTPRDIHCSFRVISATASDFAPLSQAEDPAC